MEKSDHIRLSHTHTVFESIFWLLCYSLIYIHINIDRSKRIYWIENLLLGYWFDFETKRSRKFSCQLDKSTFCMNGRRRKTLEMEIWPKANNLFKFCIQFSLRFAQIALFIWWCWLVLSSSSSLLFLVLLFTFYGSHAFFFLIKMYW